MSGNFQLFNSISSSPKLSDSICFGCWKIYSFHLLILTLIILSSLFVGALCFQKKKAFCLLSLVLVFFLSHQTSQQILGFLILFIYYWIWIPSYEEKSKYLWVGGRKKGFWFGFVLVTGQLKLVVHGHQVVTRSPSTGCQRCGLGLGLNSVAKVHQSCRRCGLGLGLNLVA